MNKHLVSLQDRMSKTVRILSILSISFLCTALLLMSLGALSADLSADEGRTTAVAADHILYVDADVDDGLIGHWRFNRSQAGMVIDVSKNRNHGTLQGSAQVTSTVKPTLSYSNSHSLYLDQSGGPGYVDVGIRPSLVPTEELSMSAWISVTDATPDQKIAGMVPLSVNRGYLMGVQNEVLDVEVWDSDGAPHRLQGGTIPDATWTHVAFTWQSDDLLRTYVNGTLAMTMTASINPIGEPVASFRVGAAPWSGALRLDGNIDDVRVYNRTLSAGEIGALASGSEHAGSDWSNAFTTLERALGAATAGDEIWVAGGIYTPTNGITRTASFFLKHEVAVYGGFDGTETERNARDWVTNHTILSGDLDSNDSADSNGVVTTTSNITGSNAYHVAVGSGITMTAVLDGFSVTAGKADGPYISPCGPLCGGGLYNENGSPTLMNVLISGNSAGHEGGGIYNRDNSSPSLTNVTISGNSADLDGGGMRNHTNSSPTLTDVIISGNSAGDSGGGMSNRGGAPTLTNVTISGNSADLGGGGMYSSDSSTPMLMNVTISGNSAGDGGGGMSNRGGAPTLTNVTISGNSAGRGGGMYSRSSSTPMLMNVTISGNSAGDSGGGMSNNSSKPTLTNVIVWGNSAPTAENNHIDASSTATVTYSLIGSAIYTGTGNVASAISPFVRDPSSGPDTTWGTSDDDYGDLRLSEGAVARDTGNNAALPPLLTTDIAGNARIQNGTVDMGAYEFVVPPTVFFMPNSIDVDEGNGSAMLMVHLSHEISVPVTVTYSTGFSATTPNPLATAGDDFTEAQ